MAIYPDRKDGKLTGRFRIEVMRDGRRKRGRADTHAEAKALEAKLVAALESGEDPTPPSRLHRNLPLVECRKRAEGLLWVGQRDEPASFRKLDRIVAFWGHQTRVDTVDTNSIDSFVSSLVDDGLSDATINRYLSCISSFLKFCRKRDYRTVEVPELDWRDEDEGRIRWLTDDEEAKLLELLPEPFSSLVYVAIRTGLRASELLDLKPDQVEPAWVRLWKTKNGTARSVSLTPPVYGRLARLVSDGMPDYWQLRVQWDKVRARMGLSNDPGFVFHTCRHSYATRAIQAGVNPVVLQKLMGHKTIKTTLRYAHVDDRTMTEAALMMAAREGETGRGNKPSGAPSRTEGSATNRRNPMFGVPPQGLQILARRFDSGSGLQDLQVVSSNDD